MIFIDEICTLVANNIAGFTYGTGTANLKVGDLTENVNGVFAKDSPAPDPDRYTPVFYHQIDFWAKNVSTESAYNQLQSIYDYLHQKEAYTLSNYYVFQSFSSSIQDLDRDGEGRKLLKITVLFIIRNLIS